MSIFYPTGRARNALSKVHPLEGSSDRKETTRCARSHSPQVPPLRWSSLVLPDGPPQAIVRYKLRPLP